MFEHLSILIPYTPEHFLQPLMKFRLHYEQTCQTTCAQTITLWLICKGILVLFSSSCLNSKSLFSFWRSGHLRSRVNGVPYYFCIVLLLDTSSRWDNGNTLILWCAHFLVHRFMSYALACSFFYAFRTVAQVLPFPTRFVSPAAPAGIVLWHLLLWLLLF